MISNPRVKSLTYFLFLGFGVTLNCAQGLLLILSLEVFPVVLKREEVPGDETGMGRGGSHSCKICTQQIEPFSQLTCHFSNLDPTGFLKLPEHGDSALRGLTVGQLRVTITG